MNASRSKRFLSGLRNLGPYLLVELILPGGTLLALLLWLSQGMHRGAAGIVHKTALLSPSATERVIAAPTGLVVRCAA